jgi:spore germination protein KC
LVKESKEDLEGEMEEYNILLNGFAVFKGDKLVGYATDTTARGANWIRGKVKSGIIVVKDNDGEKISLEIIDSGVDVIPKFNK